jgi:hypothetical protein
MIEADVPEKIFWGKNIVSGVKIFDSPGIRSVVIEMLSIGFTAKMSLLWILSV